ncbi:MAG: MutS-related protein, family 1 [uncultured Thermomicrobiales bacterium]|uniref:MutS-related protein, family 1 n=1 Tax=uncultured Thermomicrobiales bacterium TaxID=1645740 RepID=A0A6J4UTI9_9BACT|nr:MAG: MutS-related protein, family 1 [uncultured Thermomicrobiales bacterium]
MPALAPVIPPLDSPTPAEAIYQERHDRFAGEARALTGRWNVVANGRLVAFALAAILLVWGIAAGAPVTVAIGVALVVVFLVLVQQHRALGAVRGRALALAEINREGVARVRREWSDLPLHDDEPALPGHPYDGDLDITGHASLLHLLDTTTSSLGRSWLRRWLLEPTPLTATRERQAAVAELAPWLGERQDLARLGRQRKPAGPPDTFLAWAEGAQWLSRRAWLPWYARISASVFIAGIVLQALGVTPIPLWLPVLVLNLAVSAFVSGPAHDIISRVASQQGALQRYGDQLGAITGWEVRSPLLVAIRGRLAASGDAAPAALRRLDRILSWTIPRGSLVYVPAQAAVLWDVHLLASLEGWQRRNGRQVRRWLDATAETEALCALAGLAGDNPGWATPDLDPDRRAIESSRLGHPLIAATVRVDNDVTIGPEGSFLLVTGSNMSGKSTLLRAIGVNAVLAGAGGPVCAASLRMPPVDLWTSVRVSDSLAAGVSFFMAELLRLKSVVDAATAHAAGPRDRAFLYLLDEILQGTNSRERRIAARRIVGRLVASGAIGAVTTHDLDLAEHPALARAAVPVHFREHVVQGPAGAEMRFDHLMRDGVATSTNALRLMEAIGLALPDPDETADEARLPVSTAAQPGQ